MKLEKVRCLQTILLVIAVICLLWPVVVTPTETHVRADEPVLRFTVTADRGPDRGQQFGSLFEAAAEDGSWVISAGFQGGYNTRLRADRHEVQFFVRPLESPTVPVVSSLPRPNDLCGTYLYARDGVLHSIYGGLKTWNERTRQWQERPAIGGTHESMRVADGILQFGNSTVRYRDLEILGPPDKGSYQLFYYANGHLCFYHVHRGEGGYREYRNDEDGFSKLYACPWSPDEKSVDLSQAVVLTLPVVGETTFAWGQLGNQVVTGSNIGGFYVFENGSWRMLLEPQLGVSYQLYSTLNFRDRLLMGQYPTGRLFTYDGETIADQPQWPPTSPGVSSSAREAQTTAVYRGELITGVWPWAELWRYHPQSEKWTFARRMFDHPQPSKTVVHPYDEENRATGNPVGNQWGQRVTSLVAMGPHLYVSTSAKWPCEWEPERFPFLAPDKWKSYGTVYRLTLPGHLGATTNWTAGPTTFEFVVEGTRMKILQDGETLATGALPEDMARKLHATRFARPSWGTGVHGPFSGPSITGKGE